nr:magnesium transporter [Mammaliicoccus lentus]
MALDEYINERLTQLLERNEISDFREGFLHLHAYEQSEYFDSLSTEEQKKVFELLSPDEVANFWSYLELSQKEEKSMFDEMNANYASEVLQNMSDDDAVDVLNLLSKTQRVSLLTIMDKHKSESLKSLLNYEEDTAGGIMTTEYVSLTPEMSVREALMHVKEKSSSAQTIYALYVVNDQKKLIAVMSLRDLINADMDDHVKNVMNENFVSTDVAEDQEIVAQTIQDYDIIAIPVVDYQHHLLGIITVDDILDVMEEEASEDYSKLAGINDVKETKESVLQTAKKRLPWLILLTFLGMITATILGSFEDTLEQVALLAAFIPIISGMSGNTGTQSLAVSVRSISTGDMEKENKVRHALHESASGFISGLVCSLILFSIIVILYGQPLLATIVGISLTTAMTVGTTIGSLIPLFMNKIGIDPAVASGPFITTINDIVSMLIYFSLATSFMSYLT